MPPKKDKAAKVAKFPYLDNVDTSEMAFEKLQQYCLQLFEAAEAERRESDKFEIERDKLLKYWMYSGNSLREALYDLRDQQFCLENDEYALKTRTDRKTQDVMRLRADTSQAVDEYLLKRCAELATHQQSISEKGHQMWSDLQTLKSALVDADILRSEILTDFAYVKQQYLELINKNLLKQRKLDLNRLKKEIRAERKKLMFNNSERFHKECRLKRDVVKAIVVNNKCSLRRLITSFDRVLSYNFERVSDLKSRAENLKKLDIMLTKEYSDASKAFLKSISSHAEGMRTLNQMRTFLYAAGKIERTLTKKKKEFATVKTQAEALSVKTLNSEMRIRQMEERFGELSVAILSCRKIMTQMIREDEEILSRNIEKLLLEFYQQKVRLYSLLSKDVDDIDMKLEVADYGGMGFTMENLGHTNTLLSDVRTACAAVSSLYNRLFDLWKISYVDLEVIRYDHDDYPKPNNLDLCKTIKYIDKW